MRDEFENEKIFPRRTYFNVNSCTFIVIKMRESHLVRLQYKLYQIQNHCSKQVKLKLIIGFCYLQSMIGYLPKPILFTSFLTDIMYQIGQNILMFKAKYRTKRKL